MAMGRLRCVFAVLTMIALVELGLRLSGYASPLLYAEDAEYEYALAPNQRTHRLGARLETNRYGMRSPDFDPAHDRRDRVLVLGDSVIAGGNWTAQDKLATSLIQGEETLVLNVSAGSWGPGNVLAYLDRHGLFEARAAILVVSSHDLDDNRTFGPLDAYAHPTRAPRLALLRAVDHYLFDGPARAAERAARPGIAGDARQSLNLLLAKMVNNGIAVCVIQHRKQSELVGPPSDAYFDIAEIAAAHGALVLDTAQAYREAGASAFRDDIHLSNVGQVVLAEQIDVCLRRLMS